ncbi:acyltransferase domain-containing protein, partial [Streptomyces sp. WG7]|uniref:acyltransferase domain-containing protein n=1 Tax=Streptomyces sp. WG7 TaxID=3417650 RepID=UPI003CF2A625
HSAQVDLLEEELGKLLAPITPGEAQVPFLSTVTGEWVSGRELDGSYWFRNLRQTVELEQAVRTLLAQGFGVFVESSPHPVLTVGLQETVEDTGRDAAVLGSLRRDEGGLERFWLSLGEAYVHGASVDWQTVFAGTGAQRVDLPTYAFQPQRFWPETSAHPDLDVPVENEIDARFWEAVEREDLEALAGTLALDTPEAIGSLGNVLPGLSSWRRQSREQSAVDGRRYRVTWKPLPESTSAHLTGVWLLAVPDTLTGADEEWAAAVERTLTDRGAQVRTVRVEHGTTDREQLTATVRAALDDSAPSGILSLLALGGEGAFAGELTFVQALGDAEATVPLWCLTRGAVATGRSEQVTDPAQALIWGLGRVASMEQGGRWGGLVDLPGTDTVDDRALTRLAGVLGGDGAEDQVALRASGMLGRRLVRARLAETSTVREWRPRGTVLVTGGTG